MYRFKPVGGCLIDGTRVSHFRPDAVIFFAFALFPRGSASRPFLSPVFLMIESKLCPWYYVKAPATPNKRLTPAVPCVFGNWYREPCDRVFFYLFETKKTLDTKTMYIHHLSKVSFSDKIIVVLEVKCFARSQFNCNEFSHNISIYLWTFVVPPINIGIIFCSIVRLTFLNHHVSHFMLIKDSMSSLLRTNSIFSVRILQSHSRPITKIIIHLPSEFGR